ncbi:MAG: efflux transporter outer membrane subunit [Comamonas sp.]
MFHPPSSPRPGPAALAVLAAAVLAGCALQRPPASIDAPVPAQWHTAQPAGDVPHAGSVPDLARWWAQAGDPALAAFIDAAQAASPTVASAAARIAEARATQVQAGAAQLPKLDGSLSASRGNTMATGLSSSSGASPAIPAMTTLQAGLQASWEIDLLGGGRAGRDAADARAAGAQARWHDARVSVAAETAHAYYAERACVRQLAVAESDTQSRQQTAQLTQLSAGAGFTAPADADLARASAADARARLSQQRTQCAVQRQALVALTGLPAAEVDRQLDQRPASLDLPAPPAVDRVPARVLAQRPDVHAAQLAVAAASAEVGQVEAQRYPRLSLSGSIAAMQLRGAGIQQTLDTWSIGPLSLSVPLFDGGTRAANAEAARARYDEAAAQYRGQVRQAVREVEEALLNLQGTADRAADADLAVQNYQASFDAVQARQASGLASLFELEDSRRTLFTAQTARVGLQRERAQAWVALYRALGGGFEPPASPNPTPSP